MAATDRAAQTASYRAWNMLTSPPMAIQRGGGGLRSPDARRKFILGGSLLVLLPIVGLVIYAFFTLSWSYSDGDRSGLLQKFSRKGWICKTYEGELALSYAPGLAPVTWNFSVRDDAVATQVD